MDDIRTPPHKSAQEGHAREAWQMMQFSALRQEFDASGSLTSSIADSAEKKPEEGSVGPEKGEQADMKDGKKERTSPESFAVHLEDSPAFLPEKRKTSRTASK